MLTLQSVDDSIKGLNLRLFDGDKPSSLLGVSSGGSRISQRRVLLKKTRVARAKISEPRPFARWPRLL